MRSSQRGDTLIEIIIAIVVIGVVVSAVVAAINTAENGSTAHRQLVTGDRVLRNYAEEVKEAVRTSCTSSGATWSASYTESGYTIPALSSQPCPAVTTTAAVQLDVTLPNGTSKSMRIAVRAP